MIFKLLLVVVCVGLLFGFFGVIVKILKYVVLCFFGGIYIIIVCGVLEMFWVLMIYFGMVSGLNVFGDFFGKLDLVFLLFVVGILVFGLCFGVYVIEVFCGVLLFILCGYCEVGQVFGLLFGWIFWCIVLLQIWWVVLFGFGNLYLILLKDIVLVLLIIFDEIMCKVQVVFNVIKEFFIFYMIVVVIYLSFMVVIMVVLYFFECCVGCGFVRNEL